MICEGQVVRQLVPLLALMSVKTAAASLSAFLPTISHRSAMERSRFMAGVTRRLSSADASTSTGPPPRGTAFVQAGSGGLGIAICKELLRSGYGEVIASHNRPPSAAFQELLDRYGGGEHKRLHQVHLDITDEASIEAASQWVEGSVGAEGLDLVIVASGMLHPSGRGETSISKVTQADLQRTFAVNCVGHALVAKWFSPLLVRRSQRVCAADRPPRLVNISARIGSISDNRLGGWYGYRMSKAALNQLTRTLSVELGKRNVCVFSVHPGTVDTDFSRPYHKNVPEEQLFPADKSASMLVKLMNEASMEQNGRFFAYDGSEIPW
ncbi:unnamed protein product [Vitrella brassicaformis CCMP3155]|uniref:Uncharacterized protein n=1 Tax=Vitrella brassicaformis (strain CCMP3155) TaxID=1169540 RepID=A0A0G4GYJ5_VITBC|nr:unnamed protein product [Vitrella brassicaformis CCMP3155]|eukprot:CEM36097.1 unnamed protein product [Vitrella brassicaformis CCMP3155]